MSRSFRRVFVLLALVLPAMFVVSMPASATAESEFVSRTNGARTSRGLAAYALRSDLTSVARRQAARMAAARQLSHNPSLGSDVSGWSSVGENVGRGSSVASIHDAFMASSAHRANILSTSFTEVGIGTARGGDGLLYVSEVFRRPSGAVYVAPAPRRTSAPVVRRTTPRRATRSAPRRLPAPAPKAAPRKVAPPDVVTPRLRAAWSLYSRTRPVSSVDRALTYLKTSKLLVT